MWKDEVLAQAVVPYEDRRRRIEAEPLPENIGALIDAAAAEAGDRVVWNFFESGETLTYGEMRRKVNGLAARLVALGIGKGTHVGVMLPNVEAFPLTWLALGRIGAVMLPINPGYTPREIAHVMKVAEADWVVTHDSTRAVLDEAHAAGLIALPAERLIVVGGALGGAHDWAELASEPQDHFTPPEPVGHDDLLNIQFTSGTSGFPKGCMLGQRYWISAGKVNAFRDGRIYRRILASTPFFYMDPQWLLLMTLYQRGTLFVAARQSTSRFSGWLEEHEIDFCLLPWVLHGMAPQPHDAQNRVVRANIYGCPRDLHRGLEERFDLNAREAFGMTEIGPAMFAPIERADKVGSGSCGVPCPFRECRIVGEDGQPVARGEIGELQIRGPGIMLGYYNNPEATAEVLKDGWFSSGDLFRQDEDGFFYIVGRKKDMIRRSAENIAAREVETVLAAAPGVAEVAVVGVPDPLRGEEVKACIRLKEGVIADTAILEGIVATAQAGLAPFKVPRFYAFVEDFPRTASLKIAKPRITEGVADLRAGSFDRTSGEWIPATEGASA
ncbi:AMP-binding protein [Cereibacter sphaeroides]|uniref:class I adenylate-forming enzyme family protein n=1 Tax=Cereibacter sphaeroides TaxID=1063 RepID=UPI003FCEAB2F